jgi:hypothetical protein
MGILALEDLINPDVEVDVTYWKRTTQASDRCPKKASVRSVLHFLTVPGAEGPVHVFHGMCRKTNGQGYEVAVSSIVSLAYSLANTQLAGSMVTSKNSAGPRSPSPNSSSNHSPQNQFAQHRNLRGTGRQALLLHHIFQRKISTSVNFKTAGLILIWAAPILTRSLMPR